MAAGTATAFAAQTPEAGSSAPDLGSGFGADLAIAHLEVVDGILDYRDEKDRHRFQLRRLDMTAGDLKQDGPFKVKAAAAFLEDAQNVRFDGLVGPVGPNANVHAVPVDGTVHIETLSWEALRSAFPGMERVWPEDLDLTGALRTERLALKGTAKDLAFHGVLDLTKTGLRYGDLARKPPDTVLRLGADARATPGSIAFKRFEMTLDEVNVKGEGDVGLDRPTTLDLGLEVAATEMRGLERWAPLLADYRLSGRIAAKADLTGVLGGGAMPEMRGTVTLREAAVKTPALEQPLEGVSAEVEFSNHGATLRQLSFRVGQTRFAGRAVAESFTPLALTYRLASPSLRLADLGLQPDDAVLESARGSGRLTWPESLSFEGDVTSDRGKVVGLDYTDLTARLRVAEERLALEAFPAQDPGRLPGRQRGHAAPGSGVRVRSGRPPERHRHPAIPRGQCRLSGSGGHAQCRPRRQRERPDLGCHSRPPSRARERPRSSKAKCWTSTLPNRRCGA